MKTSPKFLSVTPASCCTNGDKDHISKPKEIVGTPDGKFMQDVAFNEYGKYTALDTIP